MGWREGIWGHSDRWFVELVEQHAALTVEGATELVSLLAPKADIPRGTRRIREIEHAADEITHQCVHALRTTFATSIQRGDLHRLISRLDDIVDFIEAAAERIGLYELSDITDDARNLAGVVLRATEGVQQAIHGLRDIKKNAERLIRRCIEINALENEADDLLRSATVRLFHERDPMMVIKWKEIYELLEIATDRCEDVANTLEGIVLEHA